MLLLNLSNVNNNKVQISQNTVNLYIEKKSINKSYNKPKEKLTKKRIEKKEEFEKPVKKQVVRNNKNNKDNKNNEVKEKVRKKVSNVKEKTINLDDGEKKIDESKPEKKKSKVLKEKDKPETKSKKSKVYQKKSNEAKSKEKTLARKNMDNESKRDVALSSNSLIKRDNLIDSYTKYVYETLKKNVYYPTIALRRGIEGVVYIEFSITKSGEIKDIKITKSSGFSILDEVGIEIAKKCSPLKAPPREIKLSAPIVFALK
ncbi:MAG: energy transducer TonB [Deferribacterota bacterium]|nr:energy transducer TonB [Deferribacterota bacterium]